MVGSTSLLGVVGGVADLPEGLASLGNLGLVGGKSVPESGQDLGVHLGVVTGSAAKTNKKKTMNFNLEKKGLRRLCLRFFNFPSVKWCMALLKAKQ